MGMTPITLFYWEDTMQNHTMEKSGKVPGTSFLLCLFFEVTIGGHEML